MKNIFVCIILIVLGINSFDAVAQYKFFNPKTAFAIEVSLPNSDLKRLPIYRNAITSLIVSNDYIIGGTSANEGLNPFIFVASLKEKDMISYKDLNDVIKGQQRIRTGFCQGKNNILFAGTIANKKTDGSEGDGHLIQVEIDSKGNINIVDIGVPVPGEGIFSLLCDSDGKSLYGVTFPSGIFFKYRVDTKQVQTYDKVKPSRREVNELEQYAIGPDDFLSAALVQDDKGIIYGSRPTNQLFYFNPKNDSVTFINDGLPEVWGRRALGQVESWAKSKDGMLYGGNAGDGQLFKVNPKTKKVTNLGKPIMMNRLRCLAFGKDGKLYGVAGGHPGYAHLFVYDPKEGGYLDLGNPEFKMTHPGIEQGILWRGFQIATMASSKDGRYIVMGEDESLSQLLIFEVGDYNLDRIGY